MRIPHPLRNAPAFVRVTGIDDPDGTVYRLAPDYIARAVRRRFEDRLVVIHPTLKDVFIYDPGNWWDGPTHVRYEPESGSFSFSGWSGDEHFPLIGPLH